jgi:hypothetical protein
VSRSSLGEIQAEADTRNRETMMYRYSVSRSLLGVFLVLAILAPAFGPVLCAVHAPGEMDHVPAQTQVSGEHGAMPDCHLATGCGVTNVGPIVGESDGDESGMAVLSSSRSSGHASQTLFSPRPPPPKR